MFTKKDCLSNQLRLKVEDNIKLKKFEDSEFIKGAADQLINFLKNQKLYTNYILISPDDQPIYNNIYKYKSEIQDYLNRDGSWFKIENYTEIPPKHRMWVIKVSW